jgi:hypothetical protein
MSIEDFEYKTTFEIQDIFDGLYTYAEKRKGRGLSARESRDCFEGQILKHSDQRTHSSLYFISGSNVAHADREYSIGERVGSN